MSIRQIIRELILESSSVGSNRVRKGVDKSNLDLKYNEKGYKFTADQRGIRGIQRKLPENDLDKEKQMDHSIMHQEKYKNSLDKRKTMKRWWNDRVYGNSDREAWFSNSANIRCIHWLGMFNDSFDHLKEILGLYLESSNRPHELSCIGYLPGTPVYSLVHAVGIEIKNRRISFAYQWDANTEFLSTANQRILDFHKGSGVPKRPNTYLNAKSVIFDSRDVKRLNLKKINEIIIDNYTISPESVIFHVNGSVSEDEISTIEEIIFSSGKSFEIKYY